MSRSPTRRTAAKTTKTKATTKAKAKRTSNVKAKAKAKTVSFTVTATAKDPARPKAKAKTATVTMEITMVTGTVKPSAVKAVKAVKAGKTGKTAKPKSPSKCAKKAKTAKTRNTARLRAGKIEAKVGECIPNPTAEARCRRMRTELAEAPRILGLLRSASDRAKATAYKNACAAYEKAGCLDARSYMHRADELE